MGGHQSQLLYPRYEVYRGYIVFAFSVIMFVCLLVCLICWFVGWIQVKYARIMITHVCFIALTLAVSLGRCLTTQPDGLMFKQLPQDPANLNACKNMCDPYIFNRFIQ